MQYLEKTSVSRVITWLKKILMNTRIKRTIKPKDVIRPRFFTRLYAQAATGLGHIIMADSCLESDLWPQTSFLFSEDDYSRIHQNPDLLDKDFAVSFISQPTLIQREDGRNPLEQNQESSICYN